MRGSDHLEWIEKKERTSYLRRGGGEGGGAKLCPYRSGGGGRYKALKCMET